MSATRDAKLGNARSQLYLLSPPLFRNLLRCFRGTTNSMNEQRFFIFFIEFSLHEKTVEKKMTSRKRKTMASSSARKGPVIDFRGCNARACGENEICGQVKVCQTCTNNWIPLLESWTQVKNLDEQKGLRMLTDLENARLHKNFAGENPCIRLSRLAKEAQGGQTCGFDICGENDVCLPRMCHKCSEHVSSRLLGALFEQKYGKTWWEWISTKQTRQDRLKKSTKTRPESYLAEWNELSQPEYFREEKKKGGVVQVRVPPPCSSLAMLSGWTYRRPETRLARTPSYSYRWEANSCYCDSVAMAFLQPNEWIDAQLDAFPQRLRDLSPQALTFLCSQETPKVRLQNIYQSVLDARNWIRRMGVPPTSNSVWNIRKLMGACEGKSASSQTEDVTFFLGRLAKFLLFDDASVEVQHTVESFLDQEHKVRIGRAHTSVNYHSFIWPALQNPDGIHSLATLVNQGQISEARYQDTFRMESEKILRAPYIVFEVQRGVMQTVSSKRPTWIPIPGSGIAIIPEQKFALGPTGAILELNAIIARVGHPRKVQRHFVCYFRRNRSWFYYEDLKPGPMEEMDYTLMVSNILLSGTLYFYSRI